MVWYRHKPLIPAASLAKDLALSDLQGEAQYRSQNRENQMNGGENYY